MWPFLNLQSYIVKHLGFFLQKNVGNLIRPFLNPQSYNVSSSLLISKNPPKLVAICIINIDKNDEKLVFSGKEIQYCGNTSCRGE